MPRRPKPHISRHTVMNKPRGSERAPVLLLSGKWLAAGNFKIGAKYSAVVVEDGRIVLTVYKPVPGVAAERRSE